MVKKYNPRDPSLVIAPTAGNQGKVAAAVIGRPLKGRMVLAIPVQEGGVPQEIAKFAAEHGVILRELVPQLATKGP